MCISHAAWPGFERSSVKSDSKQNSENSQMRNQADRISELDGISDMKYFMAKSIREIERGRTGTGGRCMKSQTLGHWLGPARKHVSAKLWYRMTNRCSKLNFVEIEKFVKCQPFVERSSESMTVWVELNFPRCPLLKSMFPSHCDLISLYSLAGFWLF